MKTIIILLVFLLLSVATAQHASSNPGTPTHNSDPQAQTIKHFLLNAPFSEIEQLVVPDDSQWLRETAAMLKRAHFGDFILTIANVLALAGMIISFWSGWNQANGEAIRQSLFRGIAAIVLIQFTLNFQVDKTENFSKYMFTGFTAAHNWSVTKFGPDVDATLIVAEDAMFSLISEVVMAGANIGLAGAAGGATVVGYRTLMNMGGLAAARDIAALDGVSTLRVAMQGTAPELPGLIAKGGALGARVFSSVKAMYGWMIPLLQAYAGVLYFAGLYVLMGIYLLPLGFAAIAFGQYKFVWSTFSMYFTALITVMLIPMFLALGLKIAFVQPAVAISIYAEKLAVARQQATDLTTQVQALAAVQEKALTDACNSNALNNTNGGLDSPPCKQLKSGGFINKMVTGIGDVMTQKLGPISDLFNGLVNSINKAVIGLIALSCGLLLGLAVIVAAPRFIAAYLGAQWDTIRVKF